MPKRITPEEMLVQWQLLRHMFDVGLWKFEVKAGQIAESGFKASFAEKRFYDRNSSSWPFRKKTPVPFHPILNETGTLKNSAPGTLKNSITFKAPGMLQVGDRHRKQTVKVFTDPKKFNTAARHPGFCYAAVHNSPSSKGFRWGRAAGIAQRQFMGNSSIIEQQIRDMAKPTIFRGFPGVHGVPKIILK